MTFKTLSSLLSITQIAEAATDMPADDDSVSAMGGGLGPKPHPVLSRAELVRFGDKMDQIHGKLEEIRSILKRADGATGPAHKLHHIGTKGGMDMGNFDDVEAKLDDFENAIDELHQSWGSQMQSETGAFGDEDDAAPDAEADADDLPAEEDAATPDPLAEPDEETPPPAKK